MTPQRLLATGIIPALRELEAYGIKDTFDARRFLLAVALQETSLKHRRQVVSGGLENGPAASFWQFEQGGGCRGVLMHPSVKDKMTKACLDFNVIPTTAGLWEAMRYNDVIAAIAARLYIYTYPKALATTAGAGWEQYNNVWRPGKPHPDEWDENWRIATVEAKNG